MTHMTRKYDVLQIGRSWCVKKRLDLSIKAICFIFGLQFLAIQKNDKMCRKKSPFIHFFNPLYFPTKLQVQVGLTSRTARIFFANSNRIEMWTRLTLSSLAFENYIKTLGGGWGGGADSAPPLKNTCRVS